MYTMKADGVLFHDPSANDSSRMALGTEAKFELNKAGSLTFTLPPDNVVYHALRKRKSVVQLYQDSEMLFQGRVLEVVTDLHNMQEVYCEGELNLLMDSVQPAMEFEGTAEEYFRQAISNHNSLMEFDKRFVVGDVTAVEAKHKVKIKTTEYTDTLGDLRSLLVDEFGGYLRVRYSGGTRYLDYIKEYTNYSGQSVKFGVNLVDIEKRVDTQKFFTVLLPLGKIEKGKRTTIADANSGSIYLEDASAVAEYGKIVQVETFDNVNDPEELLEKAQEFLARMRENRSITIKAVDMKIVNPDEDNILLGDRVMLDSFPHDLNEPDICAKVVLLIDTPDQSEYTFGLPPDPLTDQIASRIKKTNGYMDKLREWLTVTDYELTLAKQYIEENGEAINNVMINLDAINAEIALKADRTEIDGLNSRMTSAEVKIDGLEAEIKLVATESSITELKNQVSQAMIRIDGVEAAIELKADRTTVDDLGERLTQAEINIDGANAAIELKASKAELDSLGERLSQAEIDIDGANAAISLKASQTTVDALGERVTSAELLIDGQNSKIEAKADLILLDGYVKTSDLETETLKVVDGATLDSLKTGSFNCSGIGTISTLYVGTGAVIPSLVVGGEQLGSASLTMGPTTATLFAPSDINLAHSHAVTVDGGKVTLGEVSSTGGSFNIADTQFYKDGVSAAKESVTLTSLGWTNGRNLVQASNGKELYVSLPAFSVSGGDSFVSNKTTVYFSTPSVNGYLASKTVDATSVYNAGYADAEVTDISRGDASYYADSKIYTFPITVTSANGETKQEYFGLIATEAYDAGYEAGQAAGGTPKITLVWTEGSGANQYTILAVDADGNILASDTSDFTFVYNNGWNACRDACTLATSIYTIKEYAPGTLYMKITSGGSTYYSSVGSDWVRTSAATAYNRPAAKT